MKIVQSFWSGNKTDIYNNYDGIIQDTIGLAGF